MKPNLVIGLGNTLVGDDAVGCRLAEWLALDDDLRERADFVAGGCDLLRLAGAMEGRGSVVLIDAVLSDDEPGTVSVHEAPFDDLDPRWDHAHGCSAVQAVGLLKWASPELRDVPFTLIGVAVPEVRLEGTLWARFPEIAERVKGELVGAFSAPHA